MQLSLNASLLSLGVREFQLWPQLTCLALLFWLTGSTFSPLSVATACFQTLTPGGRPTLAHPFLQLVCSS